MKRTRTAAVLLLVACVLWVAMAGAEESPVIEAVYWTFEDLGFELLLPSNWAETEIEGMYQAVASPGGTQRMGLQVTNASNASLEAIMAELEAAEGSRNVYETEINDITFVQYEMPDADIFGAYTMTGDGTMVVNFVFYPADEATVSLATQIMESLTPL